MKFLFVGGTGRSGTTLVQKVLLSHSQITGGGEFDFLPYLIPLYTKMSSQYHLERQRFFYNKEQLRSIWQDFIQKLLARNIDEKKYVYLSEKTPTNIEVAPELLDLIPDSKFIYVYRDGRDVISSFLQVKKRSKHTQIPIKTSLTHYALNWNLYSQCYEQLKNNIRFNERHMAVQYEKLVNEPQETIIHIMNFLQLPIEQKQLSPELLEGEGGGSDNVWYTPAMDKQKINKRNIGKWENELSWFQKVLLQTLIARQLQNNNYPIGKQYIKLNSWLRKLYYSTK